MLAVPQKGTTRRKTQLMTIYGYVRCSTNKQMLLQQTDALRAYGCEKIFRDKAVSARTGNRKGLIALRAALKPGDKFVVTAIDRGFRCTLDAILFLDDVIRAGRVVFVSLREVIDTSTPEGRRRYIHAAADAEYERAQISIRTSEGMQALKRRGRKFGRPSKLDPRKHRKKIAWARRALRGKNRRTSAEVARVLRVSVRTLRRALARGCKR
jgi:DNA invertase Pin-like site-specific DNA recombinase